LKTVGTETKRETRNKKRDISFQAKNRTAWFCSKLKQKIRFLS